MHVVVATLALIVASLYGFIGLYIVPRLARLASASGGWIRAGQYGAAAFFVGCALTHVAIAVHTVESPALMKGHAVAHLLPHVAQVVGGALFTWVAWTKLDVRLLTKEEARLEAERVRLREQVRRNERLTSLGQLAGGVAHDFNNLLAVILGYGHVLAGKLDDRPEERAALEQIVGAAERGAELSRSMLLFGRGQPDEPELIDVSRAVQESATLLRRAVGDTVEVRLRLADALPPVRLSRGRVEQILLNLAVNARDAMPRGGLLVVTTESARFPDPDGEGMRLTVRDTGVGMPPQVAEHAFDPFFTTKDEGQGTGLGLSIVFGIVESAGGRVEVDSTLGTGTLFVLELPGAPAEREAPEAPSEPAAEPQGTVVS